MTACKSCCPKLSWEQQSSESLWFWKDNCYLIFCLLTSYLTAVLDPCALVDTVCNEGLIQFLFVQNLRHNRQKNKTACLHNTVCRNMAQILDTALF